MSIDPAKVEQVARAMCSALGRDPDALVPTTGYANAPKIAGWCMQREWAVRHLAAQAVLESRRPRLI